MGFKSNSRDGSAVVVVLIVMTAMVVAGTAFVGVSTGVTERLSRGNEDDAARYLAEAGVREGVEAMRQGFSGAVGDIAAPAYMGGGVFWVQATPLADGNVQLLATAMSGSGRSAVSAVVNGSFNDPPLFKSTLSSKQQLTLSAGVMIDSFDSTLGTYSSQVLNTYGTYSYANSAGDVSSDANVELNANAHVFGDAIPGQGYIVTQGMGAYVEGDITPATEPLTFPPIEIPVADQSTSMSLAPLSSSSIGPGTLGYDQLLIGKDATLTVKGPATIVVNDFAGIKDANMVIDAVDGPVTFYVANSYSHGNGFEVQPAFGSPMAVAFMIDAQQDIVFPSNAKVRGAYYAPNADMTFTSSNEAWGSFSGNKVNMSNDMAFHYDESLAKYWSTEGEEGEDEILTWLEAGVQPSSIMADRRDPARVLGVVKADLPSPADAWKP